MAPTRDHVGLTVRDYSRATTLYCRALAPVSLAFLIEVTAEQSGAGCHAGLGPSSVRFRDR